MKPSKVDFWTGTVGFFLLVGAITVASLDSETTSTSRRGAGLEKWWHGARTLVGLEESASPNMIFLGRALGVAALVVIALWALRKAVARRSSSTTRRTHGA